MNLTDNKYAQFGLVQDMMATPAIIAAFKSDQARQTAQEIAKAGKLMLTGEGSSRIFPAKHVMMQAQRAGWPIHLATDASRQCLEYNLDGWAVFGASNSGKTSEVIKLFQKLKAANHAQRYGLIANTGTILEEMSAKAYVLSCGKEGAVAATKSVVEQALFYHAMLEHAANKPALGAKLAGIGQAFNQALTVAIDPALTDRIASAGTIYFAGRNDGVAEELALKTNEITRKKSDFLEGTYAVHGVEEVMNADDVVIVIDPFEDYEAKFADVLKKGVGLQVIAIADRPTSFPTITIPKSEFSSYTQLAAGWNLLVEVGIKLGINLDKPTRARKVGNEFTGA